MRSPHYGGVASMRPLEIACDGIRANHYDHALSVT